MTDRKQVFPPCYNFSFFHGVGSVIMNQEYADLLAKAIEDSPLCKSAQMLTALVVDLRGDSKHYAEQPKDGPNYGFSYFHDKITLSVDNVSGGLLAESIRSSTNGEIIRPLWALFSELRKHYYIPSKAA